LLSRQNIKPRAVTKELLDEQSPALLKELHLLTSTGALNADARRKLKQVNHLVNLIRPALDDTFSRYVDPVTIDVGAGKAYLGFILYQLYFSAQTKGRIISVETRAELVDRARAMATRLGFIRMEFVSSPVREFKSPEKINLVTALHACDTATDEALQLGVRANADYLAVVPCCQAEVAELLKKERESHLDSLWRHGIHRREFGSHLTNVIRALTLESLGYQVTVTELVGWEHSLKNEFIFAKKVQKENRLSFKRLNALLDDIKVKPMIVRELLPDL